MENSASSTLSKAQELEKKRDEKIADYQQAVTEKDNEAAERLSQEIEDLRSVRFQHFSLKY